MDVNVYRRQLTPEEIEAKEHRELVGGLWDELGVLQLEFLKSRGLKQHDRLLDVGCGALRGGVHFIRYLDAGHYCGIDINSSLIEAGRRELAEAKLESRAPNLLVSDRFEVGRFDTTFDCAIAVSVFTHLPMNHIVRCLIEVRKVLKPAGAFYASYFEAPSTAYLAPLPHPRGGIVTSYDADPYHHAFDEVRWMAGTAKLEVEPIGEWGHPRDQRMLCFRRGG